MKNLTVREFRAHMGEHLHSQAPIPIGNRWRTVALVVPIPNSKLTWRTNRKEIRAARKAALAAFAELEAQARE